MEQENTLDLSISLRVGKENNDDSISIGERRWKSPDGKDIKSVVREQEDAQQRAPTEGDRPGTAG
jgi:hypothetical protein